MVGRLHVDRLPQSRLIGPPPGRPAVFEGVALCRCGALFSFRPLSRIPRALNPAWTILWVPWRLQPRAALAPHEVHLQRAVWQL